MTSIERNAPFETIKQLVIEGGHSRIPVKDGGVDNVVGYIMTKDLLALSWEGGQLRFEDILRPAFFVPETMKALDALRAMQKRRLQLAIVVDERGMVAGLVTVEDLVEELVGEIVSEHEAPVQWLQQQEKGVYLISGGAPIRDLNRELEVELPEGEGYTTIAGLAIYLAGRIPAVGEKFELEGRYELEVLDASPRRVRRVALRLLEQPRLEQETGLN